MEEAGLKKAFDKTFSPYLLVTSCKFMPILSIPCTIF